MTNNNKTEGAHHRASFDSLPLDVLHVFFDNYLPVMSENERHPNSECLLTLTVLQFVCKRFRQSINDTKFVTGNFLQKIKDFVTFGESRRADLRFTISAVAAQKFGSLCLCEWLVTKFRYQPTAFLVPASANGSLSVMQWCLTQTKERIWDSVKQTEITLNLTRTNKVDLLRWALENLLRDRNKCEQTALQCATYNGLLDIVKYLVNECKVSMQEAADNIAASGDVDLLRFALAQNVVPTAAHLSAAAGKSLATLKILHEEYKLPLEETCSQRAAEGGLVDVLEYLRSQGCPLAADLPLRALERSHLPALRWCLEQAGMSLSLTLCSEDPTRLRNAGKDLLRYLYQRQRDDLLAALNSLDYQTPQVISLEMWKFLASLGVKATPEALARTYWGVSSETLATVRYLIEEMHCAIPSVGPDSSSDDPREYFVVHWEYCRPDVARYIHEKTGAYTIGQ